MSAPPHWLRLASTQTPLAARDYVDAVAEAESAEGHASCYDGKLFVQRPGDDDICPICLGVHTKVTTFPSAPSPRSLCMLLFQVMREAVSIVQNLDADGVDLPWFGANLFHFHVNFRVIYYTLQTPHC